MTLRLITSTAALSLLVQSAFALPLSSRLTTADGHYSTVLLVQTRPDPVGAHSAIGWARERLAEIDATIATLEENARKLDGDARARADAKIAELRASRDAYQVALQRAVAEEQEKAKAQLEETQAALDKSWNAFELEVQDYFDAVNSDIAVRRAVFSARLEQQQQYAQQQIADLKASAATLAAEQRAAIDTQIAQLQAQADETKVKLDELRQRSGEAWSVFRDGLSEGRALFERKYDEITKKLQGK